MTGSIGIRPATAADGAACAAIYAPYVRDTAITFELDPPGAAEMAARIAAAQAAHGWLVLEEAGRVIGYAHAGAHNPRAAYARTAATGIYLAQDQRGRGASADEQRVGVRGRGLGQRCYRALIDDLAGKGFHTLIAIIALPNAPSVALHEKLGFVQAGHLREVGWKFDRWHDTGWWQRLL